MSAAASLSSQIVEPIPEIPTIIIPARQNKPAAGHSGELVAALV
jgi:hypothetical protein